MCRASLLETVKQKTVSITRKEQNMRKIIVLEHITLDGVIQAGGGPEEDASGGFAYGGWAAPYDDDKLGAALQKQMKMPFDLHQGVLPGQPSVTRTFVTNGRVPTDKSVGYYQTSASRTKLPRLGTI